MALLTRADFASDEDYEAYLGPILRCERRPDESGLDDETKIVSSEDALDSASLWIQSMLSFPPLTKEQRRSVQWGSFYCWPLPRDPNDKKEGGYA